ncbi:MAG: DUF11 domain-containing protein [Flavobacteriales bacterium]|nr:DUF11 domain-containing protein [Flavobacteriales bacterium]
MTKALLGTTFLLASAQAFALTVNLQVLNETCTYANGSVYASVSGGVPPYTYLWGGGETTEGITNLSPGTYSVTVTDFVGTQVTEQATVISVDYGAFDYNFPHAYCPGQNYHEFFFPPQPTGVPADVSPWSASQGFIDVVPPPAGPGNYYLNPGPIPPGSGQMVTFWDVNGCTGTLSFTAGYPITSWPSFAVVDVQGSCANVASGQVTFTTTPEPTTDTYYILKSEGSNEFEGWANNFQSVAPNVYAFVGLEPGNYYLMHRLGITLSLLQGAGCASDSILVTIPDLGPTCGSISGSTYMDYNSDCLDTEANASNVVVEIQPGPYYTTSGGSYFVVVPNGSYTMTTSAPAIAQSCPAAATVNGNTAIANIGHQPTIPLDVAISLASGPARPGFELHYTMHVENLSSSSSGATTTTLTFDPGLTFISATPTPVVSGNTLTWNQSALSLFQDRDYFIRLQVPPDVGLIGTDLLASAGVSTANTDGELSNNTASAAITVTGSYDPNDKTAFTSTRASESLYFINEDEWIDYVIRFQNTGTDTAFNIVVTDTLPPTLDPATISLVTASHQHTWNVQGQGTLKFIFPNILLPDSNVNEPQSHGLISFRIRPHLPIAPATVIENIANIYFDFNPPVITEPSVLVAEFSTGMEEMSTDHLQVYPVPARTQLNVHSTTLLTRLSILTLDGRMVREEPIQGHRALVDLQGLPSGAYLLRVTDTEGNQLHHSFLIEHE